MSKKKKIIVIVAILLAIVISFLGGQTFSKYITEVKGTGSAQVAMWSFKVYGDNEQTQNVKLASTVDDNTLVDNKIAPGTKGSFSIKIDGEGSDVGINYNIKVQNETQKPANLFYTYQGKTYTDLNEFALTASGTINADDSNKVKEILVNWEWPYQTGSDEISKSKNDVQDTQDGKNISNYTFDIVVTGTQVIPTNANV